MNLKSIRSGWTALPKPRKFKGYIVKYDFSWIDGYLDLTQFDKETAKRLIPSGISPYIIKVGHIDVAAYSERGEAIYDIFEYSKQRDAYIDNYYKNK